MIFSPLNDWIIAEPEEAQTKTQSGFLLAPGNKREQPRLAAVAAVGPNVKMVQPGDRILFQAFATSDLQVGEDKYIAIKEEFVSATVNGGKDNG